jgi:hypothetical protein
MSTLIELTKLSGGPGSLRLLIILLAAGVVWMAVRPAHRRAGIIWLAAVVLVHLVMALPVVAALAVGALPHTAPASDEEIGDIQVLFFFDGDNRWGRLREFERIDRLTRPTRIHLLGRLSVYKDLRLMGVRPERIRHDEQMENTSDQIRRTLEWVKSGESGRAAILVSCLQAPRARLLAARAGLAIPVLAAPLDEELPDRGPHRFLPSFLALATTRDALYELVALHYYRWFTGSGSLAPGARNPKPEANRRYLTAEPRVAARKSASVGFAMSRFDSRGSLIGQSIDSSGSL